MKTKQPKRLWSLMLLLTALLVPGQAWADITPTQPTVGDGSANNPYEISTVEELYWFAQDAASNTYHCAKMTADITVNVGSFDTDGIWSETGTPESWSWIGESYYGTFDGNGHTISGLYNNSGDDYTAFCWKIIGSGTIKNLGIINSYFKGQYYVGGICGYSQNATVSNCYTQSCTISGKNWVGGICGVNNYGTISNSYAQSCDVSGSGSSIGGICGRNQNGTASNCYAQSCTVSGSSLVGGICGHNKPGTVSNSYAQSCTISGSSNVGGICGYNDQGTISNCYTNHSIGNGGGTLVTDGEFPSGEVCYLLNGGTTDGTQTWYQALGTDTYPLLTSTGSNTVYKVDEYCQDIALGTTTYSNSNSAIVYTHNYSITTLPATPDADGLYGYGCTRCGTSDGIHHVIKDFNGEGNNLELTLQDDNTYKAESMVLTDGQPFQSPVAFTVGTANYNRTMTNQWGTLCLPISLTVSAEKNAYDFYTLTSINDTNDELTITKVADGTLAEGTPVIVRRNTAESGITIGETYASVCTAPAEGSTAGDLTLTGTYTTEDITNKNGYFISNDAFWNIEDDRNVKVAPFRAWIKGSTACNAKKITLCFDDGATAIDMLNAADDSEAAAVYDLQGNRLPELRQGVNIVKMAGGQTKKIIIK